MSNIIHGGRREGSGRKPNFENSIMVPPFKIDRETYEIIPGNKAQFIRDAIQEKLENDSYRGAIKEKLENKKSCWANDGDDHECVGELPY